MTPKQSKDVDNSPLISDCHNASMHVVSDSFGEGTNHYECDVCNEFCSFHTAKDSSPSLEESKQLIEQFAPPTPSSLREQIFEIVKSFKFSEQYGVNTDLPTNAIMSLVTTYIEVAENKTRRHTLQWFIGTLEHNSYSQSIKHAQLQLDAIEKAQKAVLETRDE